jgi:hypothetical protein
MIGKYGGNGVLVCNFPQAPDLFLLLVLYLLGRHRLSGRISGLFFISGIRLDLTGRISGRISGHTGIEEIAISIYKEF